MNILVIDSSSDSLEEMATSGANEYSDRVRKTPNEPALRRLHGIMIINVWGSVDGGFSNVDFAMTKYPLPPMSSKLATALPEIQVG